MQGPTYTYKLGPNNTIIRIEDNASIPKVVGNSDYDSYLLWVAVGNTPLPADGPSAEEVAVTTAMTTRQATLDRIQTEFPTSWNNFEQMVTDAIRLAKNIPNNAWTTNDSRDASKLALRLTMFCAAKLLVLIIERQDRR